MRTSSTTSHHRATQSLEPRLDLFDASLDLTRYLSSNTQLHLPTQLSGTNTRQFEDSGVLTSDALECEICIAMGDLSLRGDADMVPTAGADGSERWGTEQVCLSTSMIDCSLLYMSMLIANEHAMRQGVNASPEDAVSGDRGSAALGQRLSDHGEDATRNDTARGLVEEDTVEEGVAEPCFPGEPIDEVSPDFGSHLQAFRGKKLTSGID